IDCAIAGAATADPAAPRPAAFRNSRRFMAFPHRCYECRSKAPDRDDDLPFVDNAAMLVPSRRCGLRKSCCGAECLALQCSIPLGLPEWRTRPGLQATAARQKDPRVM